MNGSTNIVTVPFGYINQSDVVVYLNGTLTTAYTWLTSSTIQFTASASSLNGSTVLVVRNTSLAIPDVTFSAGPLSYADLNTAVLQLLYAVQEVNDWGSGARTTV